jgi:YVTN family beta-propeller protein
VEGGLSVGSEFAGLRVERLIAAGGMGQVYLATDPTLNRRVALKVVAPALAADPRYRERFLREAQLAASLEHPAIVPVYTAGESDGELYLAMRFVDGGTLGDRIATEGALTPAMAVRLLMPVADALDTAHGAGLVHRDVKPGNVLLQGDAAFLADFGLARSATSGDDLSQLEAAGVTGTVGYVAPEQLEGDAVAGPADQYALACVLFECLTGQAPFRRPTDLATVYAHLADPPPSAAGLRPGLPRAVDAVLARGLAKDPAARHPSCRALVESLAAACGLREQPARAGHRRGIAVALVAVLTVAAAALVVAFVATRGGDTNPAPPASSTATPEGDGVAVLDPVTLRPGTRLAAGRSPTSVAVGGGSVWVLNTDDQTITRIDPTTSASRPFAIGQTPFDLAFGADALWVTTGRPSTIPFTGGIATTVARVDPATNSLTAEIPLPPPRKAPSGPSGRGQIATGLDAVWVVVPDGTIARIDPATQAVSVIRNVDAFAVAVGDGQVWTLGAAGLGRIDPETNRAAEPIPLQATGATSLAVGGGAVWVADPERGLAIRVTPGPPVQTQTIATAPGASTVSFSDGRVWVADALGGTVIAIDPATTTVTRSIAIGGAPQAVATDASGVWVPTLGDARPARAVTTAPQADDVQWPRCEPVFQAAPGRPQLLITSNVPLTGPQSWNGLAITSAIRFVLQEHRFRAGRFTLGYQACDVGGPDLSPDVEACKQNATSFAGTARVVGVVGPFQSGCAWAALPVLSAAPAGPVIMVSPTATDPELTTDAAQHASGTRSFVRVIAADDRQGAADANLARDLGVKRPFVLRQGGAGADYQEAMAGGFIEAAGKLGLRVAGDARYRPNRRNYDALVSRIVQSGADGVFFVGFLDSGLRELLTPLRQRLGRAVPVISPDALTPIPDALNIIGPAAVGMYISSTTPTNAQLSVTGRQWARRFASTQPAGAVSEWSPLAAEATEVLLGAIARSDGSRASIASEALAASPATSILGPYRFTPGGDITPAAVTILRIVGGNQPGPNFVPDFQGAALVKTITVSD